VTTHPIAPNGLSGLSGLTGRSIVVTGAGGGVGRGIARACAAEGAHVVVAARGDNGAETVALIEERGGAAVWVRCDVTRRSDIDAAIGAAVTRAGGLDAVVHNATSRRSSEPVRVEDVGNDLWEEHASVSLRAAYYCAVAALPHLEARRGRFLVMTSPAGMEGSPTLPVYGIVKGALRGFAKSLAREWGPLGVTVNLVSPLAATPALEQAMIEDPSLEARLAARIPLGRIGDSEADIGPVVAFLLGEGARYITGQTLVVDGGRFMGL
jgi:NAD(P)-dependent dehydrogenase (short-subunit alcohol dehydrogenase family)